MFPLGRAREVSGSVSLSEGLNRSPRCIGVNSFVFVRGAVLDLYVVLLVSTSASGLTTRSVLPLIPKRNPYGCGEALYRPIDSKPTLRTLDPKETPSTHSLPFLRQQVGRFQEGRDRDCAMARAECAKGLKKAREAWMGAEKARAKGGERGFKTRARRRSQRRASTHGLRWLARSVLNKKKKHKHTNTHTYTYTYKYKYTYMYTYTYTYTYTHRISRSRSSLSTPCPMDELKQACLGLEPRATE